MPNRAVYIGTSPCFFFASDAECLAHFFMSEFKLRPSVGPKSIEITNGTKRNEANCILHHVHAYLMQARQIMLIMLVGA